jgi:hypothetical protein
MWEDADPLTTICYDGIVKIYQNILNNSTLRKTCTVGKLAIPPAMGIGKPYTFLDFLKGAVEKGECSQAVQGEMNEWIGRMGEQIKDLS